MLALEITYNWFDVYANLKCGITTQIGDGNFLSLPHCYKEMACLACGDFVQRYHAPRERWVT
jgi:hypothetical protein